MACKDMVQHFCLTASTTSDVKQLYGYELPGEQCMCNCRWPTLHYVVRVMCHLLLAELNLAAP